MNGFVRTIEFGDVQIRSNPLYTDGVEIAEVELCENEIAVIKQDYTTNQPFAVIILEDE